MCVFNVWFSSKYLRNIVIEFKFVSFRVLCVFLNCCLTSIGRFGSNYHDCLALSGSIFRCYDTSACCLEESFVELLFSWGSLTHRSQFYLKNTNQWRGWCFYNNLPLAVLGWYLIWQRKCTFSIHRIFTKLLNFCEQWHNLKFLKIWSEYESVFQSFHCSSQNISLTYKT